MVEGDKREGKLDMESLSPGLGVHFPWHARYVTRDCLHAESFGGEQTANLQKQNTAVVMEGDITGEKDRPISTTGRNDHYLHYANKLNSLEL